MIPYVTSSRSKARWTYTFRGVLYGSFAWPVLATLLLIFATWWTERPGWQPPQMDWPPEETSMTRYSLALVRNVQAASGPVAIDAANAALIARLRVSPEGQEGIAAFLEKRKPRWVSD